MSDAVSNTGICKQNWKLGYILKYLKATLHSNSFTSASFFVSNKINQNNVSSEYFSHVLFQDKDTLDAKQFDLNPAEDFDDHTKFY